MERCPNCGSATRTGARFCTACGFRLPDIEAPAARSPFATTSSAPSTWSPSTWSAEPDAAINGHVAEPNAVGGQPAAVQEIEAAEALANVPDAAPGADASMTAEPESIAVPTGSGDETALNGTGWLVDRSSDEQAMQVEPARDEVAGEQADAAPEGNWWGGGEQPSWPPVGTVPYAPPPPTDDAPMTFSTLQSEEPNTEVIAAAMARWSGAETDAEPSTEPSEDFADPTPAISDSAEPQQADEAMSDARDEPVAAELPEKPVDAESQVAVTDSPSGEQSALERATALVAELQSLLPSISSAHPASSATSPDLLAALQQATGEAPDQKDIDALSQIVAAAQGRSRDIDVMLDLTSHASTIAALISAHAAQRAAIAQAVAALTRD